MARASPPFIFRNYPPRPVLPPQASLPNCLHHLRLHHRQLAATLRPADPPSPWSSSPSNSSSRAASSSPFEPSPLDPPTPPRFSSSTPGPPSPIPAFPSPPPTSDALISAPTARKRTLGVNYGTKRVWSDRTSTCLLPSRNIRPDTIFPRTHPERERNIVVGNERARVSVSGDFKYLRRSRSIVRTGKHGFFGSFGKFGGSLDKKRGSQLKQVCASDEEITCRNDCPSAQRSELVDITLVIAENYLVLRTNPSL